jgi:tyrosyl-tRNA synthetase
MADWFLQRHYKIGTDLKKIRTIGYYNIEMWKAAGMELDRVEVVWLSDELNHHSVDYWPLAVEVSRKYTMNIMARCLLVLPYSLFNMCCTCEALNLFLAFSDHPSLL